MEKITEKLGLKEAIDAIYEYIIENFENKNKLEKIIEDKINEKT